MESPILSIEIPQISNYDEEELKERNRLLKIQNINLNKGIYIVLKIENYTKYTTTSNFYLCKVGSLNLLPLNNECVFKNICKIFNIFYVDNDSSTNFNNILNFVKSNNLLFRL
jgi:hypothetical protein